MHNETYIKTFQSNLDLHNANNLLNSVRDAVETEIVEFGSNVSDDALRYVATAGVLGAKITKGALNMVESGGDALAKLGGNIVSGTTYVAANVAGIFDQDVENGIMDWRDQYKQDMKDFVAYDLTGDIESGMYGNQREHIDDLSYIKMNSEFSQNVEKLSQRISEVTTATLTGGTTMAVPLILGFLEGYGEKAEQVYRQYTQSTAKYEVGMLLGGLEGLTRWYAAYRLGNAATGAGTAASRIGGPYDQVWTSPTYRVAIATLIRTARGRSAEFMGRGLRYALTDPAAIADMANFVFKETSDSLIDNISFAETMATIGKGTAKNFIINMAVGSFDILGNSFRTPSVQTRDDVVISLYKSIIEAADAAEDADIYDIPMFGVN